MRFVKILVVLAFLIAFTAAPALAEGVFDEIQDNLMCQCGCTMVVSSCECGTAEQMRSEIKTMLAQGKMKDDILDFYVAKYGDKVLSAPKPQGFNLSAYITPFAAILLGAGAIGLIVRKWVFATRAVPAELALMETTVPTPMDELRAQMERELKEYE